MIKKKRHIGNTYNKLLKDINVIKLPISKTDYCENIYWVYAITLKDNYNKTPKEVMSELKKHKIGSRPFFYPMHKQPVFNNMGLFLKVNLPQSEKLYEKGFYIPSGLALKNEEIIKVSDVLHKVLV